MSASSSLSLGAGDILSSSGPSSSTSSSSILATGTPFTLLPASTNDEPVKAANANGRKYRPKALLPKQYQAPKGLIAQALNKGASSSSSSSSSSVEIDKESLQLGKRITTQIITPAETESRATYRRRTGAKAAVAPQALHISMDILGGRSLSNVKLEKFAHLSVFEAGDKQYGVATFAVEPPKGTDIAIPVEWAIYVDRSDSMKQAVVISKEEGKEEGKEASSSNSKSVTRTTLALDALESTIDTFGEDDRFTIIAFDHNTDIVLGHIQATKENKEMAKKIIRSDLRLQPKGSTNIVTPFGVALSVLATAQKINQQVNRLALSFAIGITDGEHNDGPKLEPTAIQGFVEQYPGAENAVIGISDAHDARQIKIITDNSNGTYLNSADPNKLKQAMLSACKKAQGIVCGGGAVVFAGKNPKILNIWHPLTSQPEVDPNTNDTVVELPKLQNREVYRILFELAPDASENDVIALQFQGKDLLSGANFEVGVEKTVRQARDDFRPEDGLYMEYFDYQNLLNKLLKDGSKEDKRKMIMNTIKELSIENLSLICTLLEVYQLHEEEGSSTKFINHVSGELAKMYDCSWSEGKKHTHEIIKELEASGNFLRVNREVAKRALKDKPFFFRPAASKGDGYLVSCWEDTSEKDGMGGACLRGLDNGKILVDDPSSIDNNRVFDSIDQYITEKKMVLLKL